MAITITIVLEPTYHNISLTDVKRNSNAINVKIIWALFKNKSCKSSHLPMSSYIFRLFFSQTTVQPSATEAEPPYPPRDHTSARAVSRSKLLKALTTAWRTVAVTHGRALSISSATCFIENFPRQHKAHSMARSISFCSEGSSVVWSPLPISADHRHAQEETRRIADSATSSVFPAADGIEASISRRTSLNHASIWCSNLLWSPTFDTDVTIGISIPENLVLPPQKSSLKQMFEIYCKTHYLCTPPRSD